MNKNISDEFYERMILLEKKKKIRTLIVLSISALFAIIFIYFSVSTRFNQIRKNNLSKDISIVEIKKDKAKDLYFKFLKFKELNDSVGISNLLSDTLDRYYLMTHVTKEKIINEGNRYFKRFPDMKFFIDTSSISVNIGIDNKLKFTVEGKFCRVPYKCTEIMEEVYFNSDYKIIHVRALRLSNYTYND